jgi:uncharacterized protein (TIGR03000 family)
MRLGGRIPAPRLPGLASQNQGATDRASGYTMSQRRLELGLVIVVCVFLPDVGFAQNGLPSVPSLSETIQASPPANQLPLPAPLQKAGPTQLPPIPDPPANPNPPANPGPPPGYSTTIPPRAPIKEPGERFRKKEGDPIYPDSAFGDGHWHCTGWRYGPRIAPKWEYPGLGGGPGVTYPWGSPGYTGHNDERSLDKCCRLWGIPVPVYTPVPDFNDAKDLIYPHRNISSPGFIYGWVGPFAASPRPRHLAVDVWAQPGVDLSTGRPGGGNKNTNNPGTGGSTNKSSGYMSLSVKVPNPGAELLVDGVKTQQTGTDRTFSSPDLEPGKEYRYEVTVRWVDQGVTYEKRRIVIGSLGQTIPLDFTGPEALTAEK